MKPIVVAAVLILNAVTLVPVIGGASEEKTKLVSQNRFYLLQSSYADLFDPNIAAHKRSANFPKKAVHATSQKSANPKEPVQDSRLPISPSILTQNKPDTQASSENDAITLVPKNSAPVKKKSKPNKRQREQRRQKKLLDSEQLTAGLVHNNQAPSEAPDMLHHHAAVQEAESLRTADVEYSLEALSALESTPAPEAASVCETTYAPVTEYIPETASDPDSALVPESALVRDTMLISEPTSDHEDIHVSEIAPSEDVYVFEAAPGSEEELVTEASPEDAFETALSPNDVYLSAPVLDVISIPESMSDHEEIHVSEVVPSEDVYISESAPVPEDRCFSESLPVSEVAYISHVAPDSEFFASEESDRMASTSAASTIDTFVAVVPFADEASTRPNDSCGSSNSIDSSIEISQNPVYNDFGFCSRLTPCNVENQPFLSNYESSTLHSQHCRKIRETHKQTRMSKRVQRKLNYQEILKIEAVQNQKILLQNQKQLIRLIFLIINYSSVNGLLPHELYSHLPGALPREVTDIDEITSVEPISQSPKKRRASMDELEILYKRPRLYSEESSLDQDIAYPSQRELGFIPNHSPRPYDSAEFSNLNVYAGETAKDTITGHVSQLLNVKLRVADEDSEIISQEASSSELRQESSDSTSEPHMFEASRSPTEDEFSASNAAITMQPQCEEMQEGLSPCVSPNPTSYSLPVPNLDQMQPEPVQQSQKSLFRDVWSQWWGKLIILTIPCTIIAALIIFFTRRHILRRRRLSAFDNNIVFVDPQKIGSINMESDHEDNLFSTASHMLRRGGIRINY